MKIVIAGLIGLVLSVGARAESEVSGQVRFAGGEPVGGADVVVFDVSDEQLGVVAKTTTDEAGQFVLALTAAGSAQPVRFNLGQSYPNPFNPSTIIPYELAGAARVRLDVFNLLGQRVITLVDDEQVAGSYTARWDARDASGQGVASGVYLYRLTAASTSSADEVMATRRMVLVDGSAGAVLPGGAVGAGGSVAETVDVIEAVEAPVYGLAVEVEGLKTYVDSAFVVGAGPVDVVLDAGRAKLAQGTSVLEISPITLTVGSSYKHEIESEPIFPPIRLYTAKSDNHNIVKVSSAPYEARLGRHGWWLEISGVSPGKAMVTIERPSEENQTIPVTIKTIPVTVVPRPDPISMKGKGVKYHLQDAEIKIEKRSYNVPKTIIENEDDEAAYIVSQLSKDQYRGISGLLKELGVASEEGLKNVTVTVVKEIAQHIFEQAVKLLSAKAAAVLAWPLAAASVYTIIDSAIDLIDIFDAILAYWIKSTKVKLIGTFADDGSIIPDNRYTLALMVKDGLLSNSNSDFNVDLGLKIEKVIQSSDLKLRVSSTEMIDFGSFKGPANHGFYITPLHKILLFVEEDEGRVLDEVTLKMDTAYDQSVTYKVRKQGAAALTVESVEAIYPADPSSGSGQFNLSATVSNRSETVASNSLVLLSYYCSSDPTIDPSDDLLLSGAPLESLLPTGVTQKEVTLSTSLLHSCYSSGKYYYGAFFEDEGYSTYSSKLIYPKGKELEVPLPNNESMEFVWIEPGTFQMGRDGFLIDEDPMHKVSLSSGFWLGKYEVTQGQWEAVMRTKPWQENGQDKNYVRSNPSHPAVHISWDDAQKFIANLNKEAGEELYRLPTEAEWEYACQAKTQTKWSFGDEIDGLGHYAWYGGNTCFHNRCYGHAVGTKRPNPWGLYDMYGNVWEWVQDWYDHNYYERSPGNDSWNDPLGPTKCSGIFGEIECRSRGIRGGSFRYGKGYERGPSGEPNMDGLPGEYMRSADRSKYRPHSSHPEIGFRLVKEEPVAEEPPETDGDSPGDGITVEWFDPGNSTIGSLDDLISDINSPGDDTGDGTSGEPDLIVKYPRAERSSSPGAIDIYATVINEGTGKSNGTILRYYNSNNKNISSGASELQPSVSVSSLDPGGEIDKMGSFNSPGVWQHYFGACVDAVDLESDTNNNCSDGVMIDDHGATRETATEVSPDTMISGYLSAGDVDYFKVDIGFQLGELTAYTTGNIDTYGSIEIPNGTLATDDNSGDGFNFKVTDNVSLGPYYIKVEGREIGDYQLHLSSKITKP